MRPNQNPTASRSRANVGGDFDLQPLEPRVLLSGVSVLPEALFMPEGFSSPTAVQVVELAYADDSGSADWQLWAHYEREGAGDEIVCIADGTLTAGDTDRIAVWGDGAALVRPDEPYSLVLRSSTDDVTALLRHSDFGAQTAQYFVEAGDDSYIIPSLRRDDDSSRDFVVFHNAGDDDATVRLELETNGGQTFVFEQNVQANRRGGWNLQQIDFLPQGVFTARISSDNTIVLAGTRYALERNVAAIELPNQTLAAAGALLSAEFDGGGGPDEDTTFFIANPSDQAIEVRFRTIQRDDGPIRGPMTFTTTVQAEGSTSVSLRAVGFNGGDDDFAIVYEADAPIAVSVVTERRSNLIFTQPETRASHSWFFDQGLIERLRSDEIRTEDVYLFNPTATEQDVTITFTFADGTRIVETKSLEPLEIEDVDARIELFGMPTLPIGGLAFTISIESNGPLVAMLEHWDPIDRATPSTSLGVPTGTVLDLVDIAAF
ncbi:hypothetical protein AY599_25600 [Leptolyngbya valderiana BDU 20041]|nr:hypothetical protein AY599_25600 [Leptolyngbya valderiana BDU 20041]